MQVVQLPGIGLFLPYRTGLAVGVFGIPSIVAQTGLVVAVTIPGRASRPAGVFPLGFGGQPVMLAGLLAEPLAIVSCILPTDIDYRTVAPAPALVDEQLPLCCRAKVVVFGKRHWVLANGHRIHTHRVGGLFVIVRAVVLPHHELATGQPDHGRAYTAICERVAQASDEFRHGGLFRLGVAKGKRVRV